MKSLVIVEEVSRHILLVRGCRVMLESDLAKLYGVPTFRLNEQVKRNRRRFPDDFMLQLTKEEIAALRSQIAMLKTGGRGQHSKYRPYVFTEQGVAMLSGVLNSERAIAVNIAIMRAFVKIREVLASHKDLAKRLETIERHLAGHDVQLGKQAKEIRSVFEAIHQLMEPPVRPKPQIGFHTHKK